MVGFPTTIGFPTKNDHFEVFWGYHHFRKHPYTLQEIHTPTQRGKENHLQNAIFRGYVRVIDLFCLSPSLDGLNSMYRKLVDFMFGCNTVFFGMLC